MSKPGHPKSYRHTCNMATGSTCRAKQEVVEAISILLLLLTVVFGPTICSGRTLIPTDLVFDLDPLWWSLAPQGYNHPSNQLLTDQV